MPHLILLSMVKSLVYSLHAGKFFMILSSALQTLFMYQTISYLVWLTNTMNFLVISPKHVLRIISNGKCMTMIMITFYQINMHVLKEHHGLIWPYDFKSIQWGNFIIYIYHMTSGQCHVLKLINHYWLTYFVMLCNDTHNYNIAQIMTKSSFFASKM